MGGGWGGVGGMGGAQVSPRARGTIPRRIWHWHERLRHQKDWLLGMAD
jgi:hypothetical protein